MFGVPVNSIEAELPEHTVPEEDTVAEGNGLTVNELDPLALSQPVFELVITTLYVPAILDVKLDTSPGSATPTGTVQAKE